MTKIILSDVDGTITRGSLVLEHASSMHHTGQIDLGELPALWAADKKNEALISQLAEAYRDGIVGMTLADLKLDDFLDAYIADTSNFYSTLARLQDEHEDGAMVMLISGSPNYLVKSFAKRFGFNGVGSFYHADTQGILTGAVDAMFHAQAKREFVAGMGLSSGVTVHAYGDTASDVPLFEVAQHSVLVQPTDATLAACEGMFHELLMA